MSKTHNEDDFEEIVDGFGWSVWECSKCGMKITRLMGRFLKFDNKCKVKEVR